MDLIILGPSNTGKTYLGNYIAGEASLPVFNCDSVQIYKHLNSLTSKPDFVEQKSENGELVSFTSIDQNFDLEKYSNIKFVVYENLGEGLSREELNNIEFRDYLKDKILRFYPSSLKLRKGFAQDDRVKNYLFDIKEPLESYSSFEFNQDLERISEKFDIKNRIIVGGTIYYGFNYLFNLNKDSNDVEKFNLIHHEILRQAQDDISLIKELIAELKEKDPEALEFIDVKNPRRLETAVHFIRSTGRKYSSEYFRPLKLRENFILILMYPIENEVHYAKLDSIIDARINSQTQKELELLIKTYGIEVIDWLSKLSYEYKYFLQIYSVKKENGLEYSSQISKEVPELLQTLKYKEHQYAKRQRTFMRRLEGKIKNL